MAIAAVETHRWTRREYEQMAKKGLLRPEDRTELLDGVIYTVSPQRSAHATGILAVQEALRGAFAGHTCRVQMPLVLGDFSEPEPDLAVVPGDFRSYWDSQPTTALLVVEVADSSLRHDVVRKLPIYARAGIAESWILDLKGRALRLYREPMDGRYRLQTVYGPQDRVSPLACPEVSILVADLLPPQPGSRTPAAIAAPRGLGRRRSSRRSRLPL